jgi:hypothetical protein
LQVVRNITVPVAEPPGRPAGDGGPAGRGPAAVPAAAAGAPAPRTPAPFALLAASAGQAQRPPRQGKASRQKPAYLAPMETYPRICNLESSIK